MIMGGGVEFPTKSETRNDINELKKAIADMFFFEISVFFHSWTSGWPVVSGMSEA